MVYIHGAVQRRLAVHGVYGGQRGGAGGGAQCGPRREVYPFPAAVVLVWWKEWDNAHDARSMEARIKRWKKEEKEELARSFTEEHA